MLRKCAFLAIAMVMILSLSACGTSPEKTAPTPTPTPAPAPKETPSPKPPIIPETATFSVETKNLIIYYPNIVDEEIAKEQAKILQQAYDFYYDLIGQEYPYNGEIINIIFDSSIGNVSWSGNPIRMGLDSGIFDGRILPPEGAFFHELVHNFTTKDRASVAKYVDINGAITEAFADLFTNYFRYEELKYSRDSITHWLNMLKKYESEGTNPYSLDWGAHKDAQPFVCSIFFYISEKYGWDVWNRFFLVARNSDVERIPLDKQGSFIDLRRSEDAIAFGNFVYILSIASGENLIPMFEKWGFQFEKQTMETTSQIYKVHSTYLAGLANQYYEEALNERDNEKYTEAINKLLLSSRIYENLGHMQEMERIEILIEEIKSKNIIIDGIMDEWPPTAAMISDPSGDVSSEATSENGVDIKAVHAFMDENYLYVAIQVYRGLEPSLRRNYFIALDFNSDQQDEYHFGVRPDGNTWVFDHATDKNNWIWESAFGVVAAGGGDTIEIRIPRKEYEIPGSVLVYCRVTDGDATLDSTKWFETAEEPAVTSASFHIDYDNPERYLKSGTQSSLNEKYSNEIGTQLSIENNNMKSVAEIFLWKHDYFSTYSAGGKLVGKLTINQIMEERMLSGCHDHGLVLVSVFRKYGFPAVMVDAAGIQWAWDYFTSERDDFVGHVFVEVYVDNNWILINSTSGEYMENYDPDNPVIPMTNPDEDKGYFVLLKGLDPEGYGITSMEQLKEHMTVFAEGVESENIHLPNYEVKKLSYSED